MDYVCHLDKGCFINSTENLRVKTAFNGRKDMVKMLNFMSCILCHTHKNIKMNGKKTTYTQDTYYSLHFEF